jgi:D-alanyl-lipoteichoic acid acyltransferase DltB (MBOAT superfamily)
VKSVLDFGFYVSFFPQLVAGPIVRASEFIPQIYKPYSLTKEEFGMAIFMILKGLIKKVFISDYISINFIDRVFDSPMKYSGFETLMSLYGYSLQVYTDFSGYTDIAIGLALLMGFKLSINFNSPYKAKSTAEFWHRWHISLSTWLKDYLYIPIGGNRNGSFGGYACWVVILLVLVMLSGSLTLAVILFSLMAITVVLCMLFPNFKHTMTTMMNNQITMLLGGLWHGSSWMFVIWGGYNGFGLVVYKLWKNETQIFRWIILVLLNAAAYITYQMGLWSNPNGVALWMIADGVWFYCYFVWLVKISTTRTYNVLKYILGTILIAFFSLCAIVVSGLWNTDIKILSLLLLTLFTCVVFYIFDKWDYYFPNCKPSTPLLTIIFWGSFILSATSCFFGNTGNISIAWLLISVVMLSAYTFNITKRQIKEPKKFIAYIWGIFLTFNFITFTRIWFRAPDTDTVNAMLERLLNGWGDISLIPTMVSSYKKVFAVILFGMLVHWLSVPCKERYTQWFINTPIWAKILICVFTVFMLYQVKASDLQPFIYFQF